MTDHNSAQGDGDCACAPAHQKPKPNGTCATCGGWLPGERSKPLPFTRTYREEASRYARGGAQIVQGFQRGR